MQPHFEFRGERNGASAMPAFGRRSRRSSTPPQFTWEPEARRPRRYVAAGALALTVAALAYGTAQVASYMRTPADRAVTAKAPAVSAPNAGTMTGAADRAGSVAAAASTGPDAPRSAAARQETAPQPANSAPDQSQSSSQASTSAPSQAAPRTGAPDQAPADDASPTVAVLNAGAADAEGETKSEPLSQAKARAEKSSRAERRRRLTNLRPRKEPQLGVRQRRSREVREADLPWRFAPTLRADIDTLRREDGRPPQPFAPRYYGWSGN
jgi:hypothetical protein